MLLWRTKRYEQSRKQSRPLGQLIRSAALALILGFCLAVPDALADYVPGLGSRDFWYWSYEPSPIEIFLHANRPKDEAPPGHTIHLPRAMVYYASGYTQPQYRRLPDRIETPLTMISLTYPDGAPLSIALAEASRQTGKSESVLVGTEDFRLRTYSANLFHSEFGVVDEEDLSKPWSPPKRERYVPAGEFDGLAVFSVKSNPAALFYIGSQHDEFYFARCFRVVTPTYWCSYNVRISENVRADVSFADLRANGGRDFANERVRALRRALCRNMECEIVAAEGSLTRREQK